MYFNLATQTLYYFSGGALLNLPERSGSSNPYNRRTLPEPRSTHPRRRERKKEKRRERERERERSLPPSPISSPSSSLNPSDFLVYVPYV